MTRLVSIKIEDNSCFAFDFSTMNENILLSLFFTNFVLLNVEFIFNVRTSLQVVAAISKIFNVVFCILKCI